MKILFLGDIVGRPGREAICKLLPLIKEEEKLDFVIANAENAAGGSGLTTAVVNDLFKFGCSVLTSGDHIWRRQDVLKIIDHPYLLRPLNLSPLALGKGYCFYEQIAVVNLQGRVFMDPVADCPFNAIKNILPQLKEKAKIIFIDFHAEATSEKVALGYFLDGEVSAVLGSHTHIQTADEKILPKGTAFITDAGMTGPCDSVIGRRKEVVIEKFVSGMPGRFEVASYDVQLQGVIVEVEETAGKAISIKRVQKKLPQ